MFRVTEHSVDAVDITSFDVLLKRASASPPAPQSMFTISEKMGRRNGKCDEEKANVSREIGLNMFE
jgi:hypothetical protein